MGSQEGPGYKPVSLQYDAEWGLREYELNPSVQAAALYRFIAGYRIIVGMSDLRCILKINATSSLTRRRRLKKGPDLVLPGPCFREMMMIVYSGGRSRPPPLVLDFEVIAGCFDDTAIPGIGISRMLHFS